MDPATQAPEAPAAAPVSPAGPPVATPPPAAAAGTPAATSASPKETPAAASPAPGTPKTELEIKLPDGLKADAALLGKFKSIATEHGLTSKQAQALVDFNLAASKEAAERDAKAWEQQKAGFVEQLKADPKFGGANYEKNLDLSNKALRLAAEKAGLSVDAVVKEFADTGVGVLPTVVKILAAFGTLVADDKLDVGTSNSTEATGREAELRSLFPKSYDQMTQKSA